MTLQTNRIYDVSMVNKGMVEIPKGKIELRDDRTKDEWTVEIEPFLLLKFLVTQDLYYEITKSHLVRLKGIDDLLKQLLGKTQYFSVIPYLAEQDLTLALFLQQMRRLFSIKRWMVFDYQQKQNGSTLVKREQELSTVNWNL